MTYSQQGLPPAGQDSGSGTAMQMVMALLGGAKQADAQASSGFNEGGGVGYEPYGPDYPGMNPGGGLGYTPYGPTYTGMSYNPSIYGQLGVKGNDY